MSTVIGLTGQTGSGKTTVCRIFLQNGFAVIDCDSTAREVASTGSECCRRLSEIFPDWFDEKCTLDRKKLGTLVFSDKKKLVKLNNIIFPYIIKNIEKKISMLSDRDFIILDAPTLFEAGADKLCSIIVSVTADENIRLERIIRRDNLTPKQAADRIKSQYSEEFFREHSDYVIINNKDEKDAYIQTQMVINSIKESINGKQ